MSLLPNNLGFLEAGVAARGGGVNIVRVNSVPSVVLIGVVFTGICTRAGLKATRFCLERFCLLARTLIC